MGAWRRSVPKIRGVFHTHLVEDAYPAYCQVHDGPTRPGVGRVCQAEPAPGTVRHVLDRLRDAWNAADASAYARLFTEDATYGDVLTGRSEIQKVHHDLFTRSPSKALVSVVDSRLLDGHTAIVLTIGGTGREEDLSYDKLKTFVMVEAVTTKVG